MVNYYWSCPKCWTQGISIKRITCPNCDFKRRKNKSRLALCHDCNAKPGETHSGGCDVEHCSVCGGQRLCCICKGHDKKFARWTGICPGKAEADFLGIGLNDICEFREEFFIKPKKVKR